MRVRSLLLLGCALAALLIGTRTLLLELGNREQQRLEAAERDTDRVARDTAELLVHTHEMLRGQAHGARQWRSAHAELEQALARLVTADPRLQSQAADALEVTRGLPPLFDAILKAQQGGASDDARRDMLSGHLLAETRRVSDEAFALSEVAIDLRRELTQANTLISSITMGAFTVLVIAVAVSMWRRVLLPMARVEAAARAMRSGALDARADYRADDEFGDLAQTFDAMAAELQERSQRLQAAREETQRTLDAIPALVGYWDPTLRLRSANNAFVAWFGIDRERLIGMPMSELLGHQYETSRLHAEAALGGEPQVFEHALARADGRGERQALTHFVPDVADGAVRGFYCCVLDITEQNEDRARLAHALAENQTLLDKLSAILEAQTEFVSLATPEGTLIYVNSAYARFFGLAPQDMIGTDLFGHIARAHRGEVRARFAQVVAGSSIVHSENLMVYADGTEIWVAWSNVVQLDNGRPLIHSVGRDITASKQLELELADSERFLRQVTDGLPIRIAYFDRELRYRFANAALCARIGLAREEILGRRRSELLAGQSTRFAAQGTALEEHLQAALAGADQHVEFSVTFDGELHHIESRVTPARDAQGRVVGLFSASTDITERKQAEVELRKTSALLGSVLESASEVSIIATDPQLNITVFNRGAEQLLGWRADEMVGRATPAAFHDAQEMAARAQELTQARGQPVEGGAVFIDPLVLRQPREWIYVRKDGSRVAVSLVVTAMLGPDGETLGYLGIAHDVTRQKEAEHSLRIAMEQAHHASLAKSQFLANMSHEIRTPMNAVNGLTFLLAQTRLDAEQGGLLGRIETANRTLLALLNNVLDLSKVEAGELAIEHTPFDLARLLRELSDIAQMQTGARPIAFDVVIDEALPPLLIGDPTRLNQVLMNLVANAVKFTEHGGVVLRAQALQGADAVDGSVRVRFEVEDSGIGIEPAVQARLFAPFVQADESITRRFGGTGLGLSIVKTLVAAMGGTVAVQSEPGRGSTFSVELPFAAPATLAAAGASRASAAPAESALALVGVRVLVVDDSEINLDVARRILEREGARVTLAASGLQACELVQAEPQGFDIVLMDVQMPGLDGCTAARRIRHIRHTCHIDLGHDAQALPIIALTAGALSSERQRAIDAGMSAYVTKPFDPRALVRTIGEYAARREPQAEAALQPALAAPAAAAAAVWPELDGIDAADVRKRLDGDVVLFVSLLRRMFEEFDPLLKANGAAALDEHAARMHKLRGTAGLLGAHALHAAAGAAEAAARAGDAPGTQRATQAAAQAFDALAAATAPLLAAALDDPAAVGVQADVQADVQAGAQAGELAPIDAPSMHLLTRLLREHNLEALDRFETLAARLRQQLGDDGYQALRRSIDALQFDQAAQTLEQA